jgi:hypothetical protein
MKREQAHKQNPYQHVIAVRLFPFLRTLQIGGVHWASCAWSQGHAELTKTDIPNNHHGWY